jgi:hypothetical protein
MFEDWADVVLDIATTNSIISSEEANGDKIVDILYEVWEEMGFEYYKENGQGISTSDYNMSVSLLLIKIKE